MKGLDYMLCSKCNKNEANFHYQSITNGKVSKFHLCSECAKEMGFLKEKEIFPKVPNIFADFLSLEPMFTPLKSEMVCPSCNESFDKIKKSGFLGCEKCYEHFSSLVENILSKIQPSTTHKGKLSGEEGKRIEKENELKNLKEELKRAVIDENYEKACILRDKIKDMEKKEEK